MALPRRLRQTPHELSSSDWCPLLKTVIMRFSPHSTEHQQDIYSMQASQVIREGILAQQCPVLHLEKVSLLDGWMIAFLQLTPFFIHKFHS